MTAARGWPATTTTLTEVVAAAGGRRATVTDGGDWRPRSRRSGGGGSWPPGWAAPEKIARQHATGRLTARERIELLADPGSFAEIGAAHRRLPGPARQLRGRNGPDRRAEGPARRRRLHRARRVRRRRHPREAGLRRAVRAGDAAARGPAARRGQRRRQREDGPRGRVHLRAGQPGLGRRRSDNLSLVPVVPAASGRRSAWVPPGWSCRTSRCWWRASASCSSPARRWCAAAPART